MRRPTESRRAQKTGRPARPDVRQTGQRPSHAYPTTSGRQQLSVASGCMTQKHIRDAKASLSWRFSWWQVLGSNQRRLSRRFYREPITSLPYGS